MISNLNVIQNIALIKEYHHHLSRRDAEALALSCLNNMGLKATAFKRTSALSDEERFIAMVLRAVMVQGNAVAIDRPFKIMPELEDYHFIWNVLKSVDEFLHEGHIFDYIWNQERYEEEWG
ncbi:MAG: hypothetical protein CSYNP_02947 [Syntrophus sp. SKADARSKE-3]|nr:hypothetical protein [Syntrophus sp. SKADARSKE-3]